MASRPLIKESLQLLHFCGLDPHKRDSLNGLRVIISTTTSVFVFVNSLLKIALEWHGLSSMEDLVIVCGFYQLLTKMYMVKAYGRELAKVLEKIEKFWPIDKYGSKLEQELRATLKTASRAIKCMVTILLIAVAGFCFQPLFSTDRKLPYPSYYPTDLNQTGAYRTVLAVQLCAMLFACTALLGFDSLFVSLIINITCELKILKEGFKTIPINSTIRSETDESLKEVYRVIDHHNLILGCVKDIKKIYSLLLLNVYFFNMALMCFGLLCIIATGFPPTLESLSKYGVIVAFYIFQLFFYCSTGTYLITESESVSEAIYATDWWVKTQPQLRRSYVLAIQRANKAEKLTAGGMFVLNLSSFTQVTKTALSFFTLVEALYDDK